MADDGLNVALRFALYLDLMLVFGVALFGLRALRPEERASAIARRYVRVVAVSVAVGIVLSLWSAVVMAKAMTGAAEYAELTGHVFGMILGATAFGLAWAVRMAALVACLPAALALRRCPTARFAVLAALGATALATLTWAGHGAMDQGARGVLHAATDIAHLLAAGAWVGALVAFVLLASAGQMRAPGAAAGLSGVSSGFAGLGTLIVATLAVTGAANYLLIVGPPVEGLFTTVYGGLLLAKLAVFALMLGLAAANRFRLSPRLAAAVRSGDPAGAVSALRASLIAEACLGGLILGLVAWLGVLSPPGA
ncbi:copper resistance protein CopD (plasmid) [Ralstonia solanacearum]|nr:copper resistance protein CopD [Ralstonia solanacearum]